MRKLVRITAAAVTTLSLAAGTVGMAAAQTGGTVSANGPDSSVRIRSHNHDSTKVNNTTSVGISNTNKQRVHGGDVSARHNTTVGDLGSGAASATNTTTADLTVDNSGATAAALANSGNSGDGGTWDVSADGPDSSVHISSSNSNHTEVNNTTTVSISNSNDQHVSSGDASASHNTTVGDVTSGDASASNSSTFTLNVTN